jgi:hypothetical protein
VPGLYRVGEAGGDRQAQALFCSLRGALSHPRAVVGQRLGLLARAVPDAYFHTSLEQVSRHRGAHDPGPQNGYRGVVGHPYTLLLLRS